MYDVQYIISHVICVFVCVCVPYDYIIVLRMHACMCDFVGVHSLFA